MRVVLKRVHTVRMKLASGEVREYHYAWRGGPKLSGRLRVAAVQLPRLSAEDRAALRKYVERDMR